MSVALRARFWGVKTRFIWGSDLMDKVGELIYRRFLPLARCADILVATAVRDKKPGMLKSLTPCRGPPFKAGFITTRWPLRTIVVK
ncbi:hypothetical protein GGS23DRAFT_596433 [Durotheca rogersii]|uniref:uncharacterized protein n=1 Tax=Durotheca rogersii TaxID=419775 RepID=UPI00221FB566|nr:uncharacterized protein GGS23DRAFT_596433 [Durotheca rogersii]KAI5863949.1 hypothetical protein GGS23DRAFT_596433 [Durotheca rogersii]